MKSERLNQKETYRDTKISKSSNTFKKTKELNKEIIAKNNCNKIDESYFFDSVNRIYSEPTRQGILNMFLVLNFERMVMVALPKYSHGPTSTVSVEDWCDLRSSADGNSKFLTVHVDWLFDQHLNELMPTHSVYEVGPVRFSDTVDIKLPNLEYYSQVKIKNTENWFAFYIIKKI